MRVLGFFLVLVAFSIGASSSSYAVGAKPWGWGWWPSHWQGLIYQPYIGGQKLSQRPLWDNDTWTPEDWIKDAGDSKRIMRDFYATNIITGQYTDGDDIPVLEVGNQFVQLSGIDRQRILQFVDHVFEITTSEENGMFYVFFDENKSEAMGVYNKYGFLPY